MDSTTRATPNKSTATSRSPQPLATNNDSTPTKKDRRTCRNNTTLSHLMRCIFGDCLLSVRALNLTRDITSVEDDLLRLRGQRLDEGRNLCYIHPQARTGSMVSGSVKGASFSLMDKVAEFLASHRRVFLLMGASGSGKTTFNLQLEYTLWKNYNKGGPIPLYINLPKIDSPEHDLIGKVLRSCSFTADQIQEMRDTREFILICDGYDESKLGTKNLHITNCLNQPGQWRAKVVISCRTQYLGVDYRDRFLPYEGDHYTPSAIAIDLFQEAAIASFSKDQIREYVERHVANEKPEWSTEEFMDKLGKIPNLLDLASNPFLLVLAVETLPDLSVDAHQSLEASAITRAELYDVFVKNWLDRNKQRLVACDMDGDEQTARGQLLDVGFEYEGINFTKGLAAAIYKEQDGRPSVKYNLTEDGHQSWKTDFFGPDAKTCHLRISIPLCRRGNQFRFLHKSLLEYFYSCVFFDPSLMSNNNHDENSCDSLDADEDSIHAQTTSASASLLDHALNKVCIVENVAILEFLVDRVKKQPIYRDKLIEILELSKKEPSISTAAANAMTILVRARVKFHGWDLRFIRIRGADLSGGLFDLTNFREADIRDVDFTRAWMREADLRDAKMDGVKFGELPYLTEEGEVRGCAYSPDEKYFATGSRDGTINIYDTTTWRGRKGVVLKGVPSIAVNGLAFSPDSQQIAMAYDDGKVRIWGVTASCLERILESHSGRVNCVAYCPNGQHIASGSDDCSVIVWDARTGDLICSFKEHTGGVNDVAFSPDGKEIVTASADNTVRLWRIGSNNESILVGKHTSSVSSIAFSPLRHQVVSGGHDKTVRVWNLRSDEAGFIFKEHTGQVWSVAYSPDGRQIASGGQDCSIRLWNARKEGKSTVTLDGHTAGVLCVRYSPSKDQIASTSADCNVRLWSPSENSVTPCSPDVGSLSYSPDGAVILSGLSNGTLCFWDGQTGAPAAVAGGSGAKICGHNGAVKGAVFSSDGSQIASCGGDGGGDRIIRIWYFETGKPVRVLEELPGAVLMTVYSPVGSQLASCTDDGTIHLWDTRTGELEWVLGGQLVHTISYSPDGAQLATCSKDKITFWNTSTRACTRVIQGDLGDALQGFAYSPDGRHVAATAESASKVNIWSCTTGELYKLLQGADGCRLFGVSYSPSGDLIATAASDKTLKLWDVESGVCVLVLRGFSGLVTSVAWSPVSSSSKKLLVQRLVTGSTDRAIRQWEIMKHDIGESEEEREVEGKERYGARLIWGSGRRGLSLDGARVSGASGVSQRNLELFRQRGALFRSQSVLCLE